MSIYLITGRAGTGKSTIAERLRYRGQEAYDTDRIPRLVRWEHLATGEPVKLNDSKYVDLNRYGWNWSPDVMKRFFGYHKAIFFCGSASNQSDYYKRFKHIFVLTLDRATHEQRLAERTGNNFGKHPKQRAEILDGQAKLAEELIAAGATPLDATRPVDTIVDQVLEYLK